MTAASTDPVIRHYREQISDNDLKILEALNKRVKLVKSLTKWAVAMRRSDIALKSGHQPSFPYQIIGPTP